MTNKTENRGGARKGAGRPRKKKSHSEKVKNAYVKAARELAKEFGEPIEKAMLRMVYDKDVQDSVKASIMKTYNEALLIKESDQNINVNAVLPSIIDTPANRQGMPDADTDTWVKPEQLAEVICFLASDRASAVHGALVPVRGRA